MNRFDLYLPTRSGKQAAHTYSGPSCWSELSPHQAIVCTRLRRLSADQPAAFFPALKVLYGMSYRKQRYLFDEPFLRYKGVVDENLIDTLDYGQSLLASLSWIGEPDKEATFPVKRFRLLDFQFGSPGILFSRLRHRRWYAGPAAGLATSTFGEFTRADKAYRDQNFPRLAAVLYRPADNGAHDGREAFDHDALDEREQLFARLNPDLLSLIAYNYGDTLLHIAPYFKHVFRKSEEQETKKKSGTWIDVLLGMAKLDVTKVRMIENENLYLVLKTLDTLIQQNLELEAELEKQSRT